MGKKTFKVFGAKSINIDNPTFMVIIFVVPPLREDEPFPLLTPSSPAATNPSSTLVGYRPGMMWLDLVWDFAFKHVVATGPNSIAGSFASEPVQPYS